MYIPDRVIVRKLREYDPYLFVLWNNQEGYWEVWRHFVDGRKLITPVIESIYDERKPSVFAPLDERILYWLVAADSQRSGGSKKHAMAWSNRTKEATKRARLKRKEMIYDASKDAYRAVSNFYVTKKARTQDDVGVKNWVRPDSQSASAPRTFARSKQNALAYNFRRK